MNKMNVVFTKMHGIGNDYIYVNCMDRELDNPSSLSVEMSKRHFSVGADGLVMICPSDKADAKMRMFNADGSEGKMCGNAIRCVGKYLYDNNIVNKKKLDIETLSGIKHLVLDTDDISGKVKNVTVDMGTASLNPADIPVLSETRVIKAPFSVGGREYSVTCVSMGNPHAVIFTDDVKGLELERIGPEFENHHMFPERINTEFVRVIDHNTLEMRVWERGSGETYACGTGACASVVAAVVNGICMPDSEITVKLIGGDLKKVCSKELSVTMTGSATKVYEGSYETCEY